MLLPWQRQVHTYHLIPINTMVYVSWHITQSGAFAQPNPCRPFVASTVWLQFGNFFWIQTDHPSWFQYTEKITLFCITQHAMELPQFLFLFFLHFCIEKLWQCCLRASGRFCSTQRRQSHPSTKPSANLLPNSFCYPTITPQAPWIPGTQPESGTVLNKKRHRC